MEPIIILHPAKRGDNCNMKSFELHRSSILRRKYWLVNAILSIVLKFSRFFRNKKIWVFGCWNGFRYDDSTRFVYEYLLESNVSISPYWITKSEEIYSKLKAQRKPVLLSGTKEAKKKLLSCGAIFYTNGIDDISNIYFSSGAMVVNLNHAPIALKELKYFDFESRIFPIRVLKIIKKWLFNWFYFDYIVVPSEKAKRAWMFAFCDCKESKYFICGLPRYDILLSNFQNTVLGKYYNFRIDYQYILYLPTYRKYENTIIADFIKEMNSDEDFQKVLDDRGYKIIIKPHFAEQINLDEISEDSHIIVLNSNDSISTQELLGAASILISDYSSCVIDYAISGRPILLFTPDLTEYIKENGIAEEFRKVYFENSIQNYKQLINVMISLMKEPVKSWPLTEYLNNEYNRNDKTPPYSKEVVEFICKRMGLVT